MSVNNNVNTSTQTGLAAGTYSVIVSDANSCTLTLNATITQPPALSLTINSSTTNICAGGVINVNGFVSGGTGPYTYTWSPGPNSSAYNISETVAGTYNYGLSVLDKILSSSSSFNIFIVVFPVLPLIHFSSFDGFIFSKNKISLLFLLSIRLILSEIEN